MRVAAIVVLVSVLDHTVGSFNVLHEQDRSASAFWLGAHLLAWPGALLGRDTDASPWGSPPRTPSRADAALRGPDTIARPAQIGERDGER